MTTYANWVAKTASLLVEEHDLERGDVLARRPADALAGPGLPRAPPGPPGWPWPSPASDGRARRGRVRPRRPGHVGDRAPTTCRCWPARCCRWASGSPSRCRRASTTSASRCGRSRTRSCPTTRRTATTWRCCCDGPVTQSTQARAAGARSPPGGLTTSTGGDRLLSTANPASPPGVAAASRAARVERLAGPRGRGGPGSTRRDRRGRAGHRPADGLAAGRRPPRARGAPGLRRTPLGHPQADRAARAVGALRVCAYPDMPTPSGTLIVGWAALVPGRHRPRRARPRGSPAPGR